MLLFCDSFDLYSTATIGSKYDVVSSSATISMAAARNGTQGLSCGNDNYVQKNIPNRATVTVGFALFVKNFATNRIAVAFMDGTTMQCCLTVGNTGILSFNRGLSTSLGSTSSPMSFGCWHYVEVQVTIGSSGSATVKVDGATVISASGNTQSSGSAQVGGVLLGDTQIFDSGTFYYDDFYITDTNGSYNTGFLGDIKVSAQIPSGNGSTNNYSQNAAAWAASTAYAVGATIIDSNGNLQRVSTAGTSKSGTHPTWATTPIGTLTSDNSVAWTLIQTAPLSNYNFVNDVPPDDNSSYLSDATVNDKELYTFPAMAGASVFAVAVNLRAEKDDASTRSVRALAKSSSTTVDNGTDFPLSQNVYMDYQGIFETDPNTSAPWTIAGVNAAQFGINTTA